MILETTKEQKDKSAIISTECAGGKIDKMMLQLER
jgi:hypothetical protein